MIKSFIKMTFVSVRTLQYSFKQQSRKNLILQATYEEA